MHEGEKKASSNWMVLKKKLKSDKDVSESPQKRRKTSHEPSSSKYVTVTSSKYVEKEKKEAVGTHARDSLESLRKMVLGEIACSDAQRQPGKYLAIDCEMVGVGIEAAESSLARVSIVNYYGVVQIDEFVRQRERVVDYRTQYSGIRDTDMVNAKPFLEIQSRVAELIKDKILVGHAIHNDLKALLLSHPRPMTRDTQYYAGKSKVVRSKYVALRNLVKQELDMTIQEGEHSSVVDARATMAVYRIHRKEWEKHAPKIKRKRVDDESDIEEEVVQKPLKKTFPGGGRRGVSSGLSTVVKRLETKKSWWSDLPQGKGS